MDRRWKYTIETVNDKVKYTEKNNGGQIKQGGILESLNGTNETDYKFSARAVIDQYEKYDMQLGWFLPNDGYVVDMVQTMQI